MIHRKHLTEEQAREAVRSGEFGPDVRSSRKNVAIVLTQDWCPQWSHVDGYLDELAKNDMPADIDIDVYELEYNKVSYGNEFMRFKETIFKNNLIPYIRYYREGLLISESNFISRDGFLGHFAE